MRGSPPVAARPSSSGREGGSQLRQLLFPLRNKRTWFVLLLLLLSIASLRLEPRLYHQGPQGPNQATPRVRRLAGSGLIVPARKTLAVRAPSTVLTASSTAVHSQELPKPDLEVWARPVAAPTALSEQVASKLGTEVVEELVALCGRCLYRTLTRYVRVLPPNWAFVLTGDIPAMWIRDSAVQIGSLLPRVKKHPALRGVVEGTIRAQAFFLLQDPWANAFNVSYSKPGRLPKLERHLGRGGWVWTRNFELDSIAYFYNLLYNYHETDGLWGAGQLLSEPAVHDAVVATLQVLVMEQDHDKQSPYRYSELARDGLGPQHNTTGMIWSAFRASDDPQIFPYHLPDNMYIVGALQRLIRLNQAVWQDAYVEQAAGKLVEEVRQGIDRHGVVTLPEGDQVYAYEVDGRGNKLTDFDDPNVPSLLAIPLLGYDNYDKQVYAATRARLLSKANSFWVEGDKLSGLSSPHTPTWFVWPMATAVQALTTSSVDEQARLLADLVRMAHGNGLMHESVDADNMAIYTRPEFGWANALLVTAVEQLLGIDCDAAAEADRLKHVEKREHIIGNRGSAEAVTTSVSQGMDGVSAETDRSYYYERLEAGIQHVTPAIDGEVYDWRDIQDQLSPNTALLKLLWGEPKTKTKGKGKDQINDMDNDEAKGDSTVSTEGTSSSTSSSDTQSSTTTGSGTNSGMNSTSGRTTSSEGHDTGAGKMTSTEAGRLPSTEAGKLTSTEAGKLTSTGGQEGTFEQGIALGKGSQVTGPVGDR